MDRQDLDGVWTVLTTSPPSSGVLVAHTGHEVTAGSVLAGIDSEGRRHLLIPLLPGEAVATDTKGRAVRLARISHEGRHYLTVFCLLSDLFPIFTQFCRELTESLEGADSPARSAASAFDRWRDLFSDATGPDVLAETDLVGLFGELLALEALLVHGADARLAYWTGPVSAVHDFRARSHAIEVKTTLAREGRIVPISGVDQLQAPAGAQLLLRHSRLERDPAGLDLPELVTRVLSAGANRIDLARLLRGLHVKIDDLGPYRGRCYRHIETRTYDVDEPAFPRILRTSFVGGDIPAGTLRLSYAIDLTNAPPFPLSTQAADAALAAFAMEVADGMDS